MDINEFSLDKLSEFVGLNTSLPTLNFSANCLELQMMAAAADPVSQEEEYKRKVVKYFLMGLIAMIICGLGIIGNIISLVVIVRLGLRTSSTYIYLAALAVCDSLVLIFTTMMLMKDARYPQRNEPEWMSQSNTNDPYPYMFPYVHSLDVTFQVTAVWLTLAFTTDRYIMICHPFAAEKFCSPNRAWIVTITIFLIGFLYNLPRFFEYHAVTLNICDVQTTFADFTDFGKRDIFRMLFHSWFYLIFVCGVPFLALAIMNSFLIKAVHESRKRGREICAAERRRNDTTIMLIGVIIIFFTCQVPALVSRMLWAFNPDFKSTPLYLLNEIGNFLVILNSAINIVPYYFFGKRFRKQFWDLFCCCLVKNLNVMRRLSLSNTQLDYSNGAPQYPKGPPKPTEMRSVSRNSSSTALLLHQDNGSPSSAGQSSQSSPTNKGKNEPNGNYKNQAISIPLISVTQPEGSVTDISPPPAVFLVETDQSSHCADVML